MVCQQQQWKAEEQRKIKAAATAAAAATEKNTHFRRHSHTNCSLRIRCFIFADLFILHSAMRTFSFNSIYSATIIWLRYRAVLYRFQNYTGERTMTVLLLPCTFAIILPCVYFLSMYPSPSNLIASVTHHFVAIVIRPFVWIVSLSLSPSHTRRIARDYFFFGASLQCDAMQSLCRWIFFCLSISRTYLFWWYECVCVCARWLNWTKCVGIKIHHVSYVWRFVIIWLVYLRCVFFFAPLLFALPVFSFFDLSCFSYFQLK